MCCAVWVGGCCVAEVDVSVSGCECVGVLCVRVLCG